MTWRVLYGIDDDAIVIAHWWAKKTERTALRDLEISRRRLRDYDSSPSRGET